jgi:hypothetical protein
MWYKEAVNEIHSVLQKGFHLAEGVVGGVATAKGVYEVGRMALAAGRALAPLAPAVLL